MSKNREAEELGITSRVKGPPIDLSKAMPGDKLPNASLVAPQVQPPAQTVPHKQVFPEKPKVPNIPYSTAKPVNSNTFKTPTAREKFFKLKEDLEHHLAHFDLDFARLEDPDLKSFCGLLRNFADTFSRTSNKTDVQRFRLEVAASIKRVLDNPDEKKLLDTFCTALYTIADEVKKLY